MKRTGRRKSKNFLQKVEIKSANKLFRIDLVK